MKKVLIIGDLSNMEKNLSDYLTGEYQIQLCTKQLDNIQAMTGIFKPDLAILSNLEAECDQPVLNWFHEKHAKLPVLILVDGKDLQQHKDIFEKEQFTKLVPPINKTSVLNKCHQLLNTAGTTFRRPAKKKILIVDDTPLILRSLKTMLDQKYDVLLASSGRQALNTILQEEPDLILLDYEMPEMNGKEVFEAILADEDMRHIPVVFLTSVSDRKAVLEILQSNPAGYILKPAEQDKLMNIVQEVLSR